MENMFISYHSLLRRQGLSWFKKDNEKVAGYHVLSVILPESLQLRLESDLDLSHHHLRKAFKGFMRHAITFSEAFKLAASGAHNQNKNKIRTKRDGGKDGYSADNDKDPDKI